MISIVIPIFNEESIISHLHERLLNASPLWEDEFEVILIDDGSTDNSLNLLRQIALGDERFKVISFSRNFGHQAAISAGIKNAKGDAVVVMDGDLQDPPEELPRFLDKWRDGYHVVYAVRRNRKESWAKKLTYKIFYRILSTLSYIEIPLDSGDFCVMDRKVVRVLNEDMREHNRFVRGLRAYAGFKQIGVEYNRAQRHSGKVKYTFKKLFKLAFDGIFDFSTILLRFASYMGFAVALFSFAVGIFFIVHRILDFKVMGYSPADVPGTASMAVGIFFLTGIILIILGIIGEYLGRIYTEVKQRPFYIIDEVYNLPHRRYGE